MEQNNLINVWSKTLLSVYRYLDTVNSAIDNLVLKHGLSRGTQFNSTLDTANKMIELTERKKKLIKLYNLIDNCLAKLQSDDIKLLVLTYFDLMKSQQVADAMDISIRTFFRRKKLATESFGKALKLEGYDNQKLQNWLSGENWLIGVFESNLQQDVEKEKEKEEDVSENIYEYNLLKTIIKDLNLTGKKSAVSYC